MPYVLSAEQKLAFTLQDLDILEMVARGYTDKQIAPIFHIQVRTVKYHVAKLHVKAGHYFGPTRSSLVQFAYESGLIKPQGRYINAAAYTRARAAIILRERSNRDRTHE
jgi:DNA-binding CsgD family transcriptional regulator